MLVFDSLEEAIATGYARIATSNFAYHRGFELVSATPGHPRWAGSSAARLVAAAQYEPLLMDVMQLEIDGCAKYEHFQDSQLRDLVFGTSSLVLIVTPDGNQTPTALFSPTSLLKAINSFREAVDLFYQACPGADQWERMRMEASVSLQTGKAAKNRAQSIRYALSICKKFGFDNLETKYQKILKDSGLA